MGSASAHLVIATPDDHGVGALVLARLVALGQYGPGRYRVARSGLSALAAAMRVIHWVHRNTAHRGTHPAPAHASRLADGFERMLLVSDFADRRPAVDM